MRNMSDSLEQRGTATPTGRVDPVSPDEIRALAARANELAEEMTAIWDKMCSVDEATKDAAFRFDDDVIDMRRIAESLPDTATDLERIYGRQLCPVEWGICPSDGRTLVESDGGTDCTDDCGRHWDHLRLSTPCREPVEYEVRDPDGTTSRMCSGHAKDAEARQGATLVDLSESD
jgi:hypothetical protein